MRLRPATLADVELLRHWDEQPHVIAADPNDEWGWETELARTPPWREQLIAELDGRPIGFMRSHRFYERLGFRFVERRLFGEDDCFVYRLERRDH